MNNPPSSKSLTRSFHNNQNKENSSDSKRICQKCLYNKLRNREEEEEEEFLAKQHRDKQDELARDLRVVFDCSNQFEFNAIIVSAGKEIT